jgi:iron complex transport system ATP-binding protein
MPTFLELQHVNVFRGERAVLHDINLSIATGEHIALLGPNGCGKSTLMKTMCCELYPLASDETKVRIFGRERWDLTELKRKLGVVQNEIPGRPMLQITGREAVITGFFSSSTLWPNLIVTAEMESRASEVLEQIDATLLCDKIFGEMSAGQQRRILIGRSLVASSGCLLLDEPSNALDLSAQRGLRELLITLAEQGTTIIHITHHIADIIPAIDRVIMMRDGRIVADGKRSELLTAPRLSELFGTEVHMTEANGIYHAW